MLKEKHSNNSLRKKYMSIGTHKINMYLFNTYLFYAYTQTVLNTHLFDLKS